MRTFYLMDVSTEKSYDRTYSRTLALDVARTAGRYVEVNDDDKFVGFLNADDKLVDRRGNVIVERMTARQQRAVSHLTTRLAGETGGRYPRFFECVVRDRSARLCCHVASSRVDGGSWLDSIWYVGPRGGLSGGRVAL